VRRVLPGMHTCWFGDSLFPKHILKSLTPNMLPFSPSFFAFNVSFPHPSILLLSLPSTPPFSLCSQTTVLEHFRYNRVYVGWLNSNSQWNVIGKPSFHSPPFLPSLTVTTHHHLMQSGHRHFRWDHLPQKLLWGAEVHN